MASSNGDSPALEFRVFKGVPGAEQRIFIKKAGERQASEAQARHFQQAPP